MQPRPDQAQVMQRLRVGLTGLALVILLILIASALFRSASDEQPVSEASIAANELNAAPPANGALPKDEPLVELGVAPGAPVENTALPPVAD